MAPNKASKPTPKGGKKSNGQKKANGGRAQLVSATSSLRAYSPKNSDGPVRSVPAAMGSMKVSGRPNVQSGAQGDSRIIHREYLGDVNMAASFSSSKYAMNPGLSRTFPWLSTIAQRYESYVFKRLRFCFETSCSSTQTGAVLLIPDYDANDSAPVSKVQALSYRNAARAQAWLSFCQESSAEDLMKLKSRYVRQGNVPSGADVKLYDVGNMFLCVQGSDTNTVGELWVEYDVLLMTPQNTNESLSANISGGGTVSKTAPFGTAPSQVGSLDVTVGSSGLTFNQAFEGIYVFAMTGTGLTSLVLGGTAVIGATSVPVTVNSAGTFAVYVVRVQALPGQTLSIDSNTGNTTVTAFNLRVGQYTYANA